MGEGEPPGKAPKDGKASSQHLAERIERQETTGEKEIKSISRILLVMSYEASRAEDAAEIERLFRETFTASDGLGEGEMVGKLARDLIATTASADLFGFVAREQQVLVGCILFSRLRFESEILGFLLAPVAVLSNFQHRGIGQGLIRHGLTTLREQGVDLVVTYGDPAYYSRLGFQQVTINQIPAPLPLSMPHGWQARNLGDEKLPTIVGNSSCVEALDDPCYW